jgi:hypothetical protein
MTTMGSRRAKRGWVELNGKIASTWTSGVLAIFPFSSTPAPVYDRRASRRIARNHDVLSARLR